MNDMIFRDRRDAGRQLGAVLRRRNYGNPLVLGLPRGGVVVAAEVARLLGAPLDVVVARKIGAPFQPELAIGAVGPNEVTVTSGMFARESRSFQDAADKARTEMRDRIRRFRGAQDELPDLSSRTAILVDDGMATGLTAIAAVRSVRSKNPARVVLAVPVASAEALGKLQKEVDEIVCLSTPRHFFAVGQWYTDFEPVDDEEVVLLIERSRQRSTPPIPEISKS